MHECSFCYTFKQPAIVGLIIVFQRREQSVQIRKISNQA